MAGITIINNRLIYLPYAKDSKKYIALIEKELEIFNDARTGLESQELQMLKQMNETLKQSLSKEE
jgi:peptidase E